MDISNQTSTWLFSDLDGTLIPLDSNPQNNDDLKTLADLLTAKNIGLAYVTGRHLSSAVDAKDQFDLPIPSFIICDVGTTIAVQDPNQSWVSLCEYQQQLELLTEGWTADRLIETIPAIDGVRLQESEKQGPFKISFYAQQSKLRQATALIRETLDRSNAPYSIIESVDPFTGDGLIDLLPVSVNKAYAARWLAQHLEISYEDSVIFSGDSGNDTAALTSGCRSILVGNADRSLASSISATMQTRNEESLLYLAKDSASSGVLEGVSHFVAQ